MAIEKFLLVGTKANLPAERDTNKLYWCSDTRELYKGMDLYTEAVRVVAAKPATPAVGVLYIVNGTAEVYTGAEWKTVAMPFVTEGTLTSAATAAEVPTAKVVYDSIVEAIEAATGGGDVVNNVVSTTAGTITVTKGETVDNVAIKGVIVNPTYEPTTRKITLPYADGTEALEINLGKDIFVQSGSYDADTEEIVLVLNDDQEIRVPASGLVDIYTGDTTSTATVSVSDDNKITATVRVSAAENNRVTVKEDGLHVDVTDLATNEALQALTGTVEQNKKDAADATKAVDDKVTVLNGDATVDGSVDKKIKTATDAIKLTTDALQGDIDDINDDTTGILAQAKAYADTVSETAAKAAVAWGTF